MCHGSGGIAGKYAFGTRTAAANIILGVGYVGVALLTVGLVGRLPTGDARGYPGAGRRSTRVDEYPPNRRISLGRQYRRYPPCSQRSSRVRRQCQRLAGCRPLEWRCNRPI